MEQELQRVKEEAAREKKKLEDELAAEQLKVRDADTMLKSVSSDKNRIFSAISLLFRQIEVVETPCCLRFP
jgi:putative heme degradation protein